MLVTMNGVDTSFFIFACVSKMNVAAGNASKCLDDFTEMCFVLGVLGLLSLVPLLLIPTTLVGGLLAMGFEAALFAGFIFAKGRRQN